MEAEKSEKIEKENNNEENNEGKREIIVPGETIVSGSEYLPGEYTTRQGDEIVATRFGLSDVSGRLVKVIPLAGVYIPRERNSVIGKIVDITFNGWIVDINSPYLGFVPVAESSKFVNKNDLTKYLDFGDMIVAEVLSVKHRGVDLTLKGRGLGKLEDGMIISINSSKVPRVIGKGGSMINLIKKETACNIIVGQNGLVWIKGNTIEAELIAKESILFVVKKSFIEGLTEKVQEFLARKLKSEKKEEK